MCVKEQDEKLAVHLIIQLLSFQILLKHQNYVILLFCFVPKQKI